MSENKKFKDAYNRLDRYLKVICNASEKSNLIGLYEKTLPEKKRSELKSIREFKNMVESHGVSVGGCEPICPNTYTIWLLNELDYCKKNKNIVAKKIKAIIALKDKNKSAQSKLSSNPYNDYYNKMYGYDKSTANSLSYIGKEIKYELRKQRKFNRKSYDDIVEAAYIMVSKYHESDLMMIATEYKCNTKIGFRKERALNRIRRELAENMVAELSDSDIKQLMDMQV